MEWLNSLLDNYETKLNALEQERLLAQQKEFKNFQEFNDKLKNLYSSWLVATLRNIADVFNDKGFFGRVDVVGNEPIIMYLRNVKDPEHKIGIAKREKDFYIMFELRGGVLFVEYRISKQEVRRAKIENEINQAAIEKVLKTFLENVLLPPM